MLEELKKTLPEDAEDLRESLARAFDPAICPLDTKQAAGVALAAAYAVKDQRIAAAVFADVSAALGPDDLARVRSAVTLMAMNNVYFRFTDLVDDPEYRKMPSKLRMSALQKYAADADWELYALAVSVVNGCAYCIGAHAAKIAAASSKGAVQAVARIAAVVHAAAQAAFLAEPSR